MKVLIVTGGSVQPEFAVDYCANGHWDCVISADSGMEFCRQANLMPDLILGDFDSAKIETLTYFKEQCPDRIETFPTHKDETDTELAILKAMEAGADEITVLGATGTRLDHVLGNIQLLKMAMDAGVDCTLVDAHNRIRMIKNKLTLKKCEQFGNYVSLIPFTPEVKGLTLQGFAYNVEDFTLQSGKARGVSNEIEAKEAVITFAEGILLVIESRD